HGATAADISVAFVAAAAVTNGDQMPTRRRRVTVKHTRGIGPADMHRNHRLGTVDVNPTTGTVTLDGNPLHSHPADTVTLSRLYFL
ncbi:urease alpha subunit, partial [Streptacidiphilus sp. BW17]